jgi:hypothetical protein
MFDINTCQKINSKNIWQTRYFYLNNEFLIYKKDQSSSELKGVLDVSDMLKVKSASANGGLSTDLEIHWKSGAEPFILRCTDEKEVSKWSAAITARMQWKQAENEAISRLAEDSVSGALVPSALTRYIEYCQE